MEDRPRVSTLCQITLIKKDEGFSPRIRLWKKDKTKLGKQTADHTVEADATTTVIKATVDTDACHENFWKLIDFIQSFKGISLPESVVRVVTSWRVPAE